MATWFAPSRPDRGRECRDRANDVARWGEGLDHAAHVIEDGDVAVGVDGEADRVGEVARTVAEVPQAPLNLRLAPNDWTRRLPGSSTKNEPSFANATIPYGSPFDRVRSN